MDSIKKIFNNNIYMLGIVAKNSKLYIFIFILNILFSYCKDILLVMAPKFIFDSMQNGSSIKDIVIPVVVYVSLYFILYFISNLIEYFKGILEAKLKLNLNVELGNKFMHLEYRFLEQNKSIDMFNKARMAICGGLNDIQTIGMAGEQGLTGFFEQMGNIIKDVMVIVSVLYVFSYTKWYVVLCVVVAVVVNLTANIIKTYTTVDVRKEAGPYLTKSRYCNGLLRRYEYGKEFRIFNMSDFVIKKFDMCTDDYLSVRDRFRNKTCLALVISSVSSAILKAVILIYLVFALKSGSITVGDFSMIFAAVLTFSGNTVNLVNSLISMNIFSEFMIDYQNCMNLEEVDSRDVGKKILNNKDHVIEFKDVWYKYPASSQYAIKGLNVKIDTKMKWSVVGFNGAGKSTFIKLLLGLYQPEKGEILIDGINMKEYSSSSITSYMSAVFQDYKIFALRIDENIAMKKEIDSQNLQDAMQKSGIIDKVNSLEKKEASVIGGFFDAGDMLLSGGESQKIAMSRSFYRKPQVFLLDEPTSALDVISEDKMYKSVAKNLNDELVIFISHRLASTKFCDKILVFENGMIVEAGTHEALLEKQGIYAEMWKVQAEKFQKEVADNEEE